MVLPQFFELSSSYKKSSQLNFRNTVSASSRTIIRRLTSDYSMNHLICNITNLHNLGYIIERNISKKVSERSLSADFYYSKEDLLKNVLLPSSNASSLAAKLIVVINSIQCIKQNTYFLYFIQIFCILPFGNDVF